MRLSKCVLLKRLCRKTKGISIDVSNRPLGLIDLDLILVK